MNVKQVKTDFTLIDEDNVYTADVIVDVNLVCNFLLKLSFICNESELKLNETFETDEILIKLLKETVSIIFTDEVIGLTTYDCFIVIDEILSWSTHKMVGEKTLVNLECTTSFFKSLNSSTNILSLVNPKAELKLKDGFLKHGVVYKPPQLLHTKLIQDPAYDFGPLLHYIDRFQFVAQQGKSQYMFKLLSIKNVTTVQVELENVTDTVPKITFCGKQWSSRVDDLYAFNFKLTDFGYSDQNKYSQDNLYTECHKPALTSYTIDIEKLDQPPKVDTFNVCVFSTVTTNKL